MNCLILFNNEIQREETYAVLKEERVKKLLVYHDLEVGRELQIGVLNGKLGKGRIKSSSPNLVEIEILNLEQAAPKKSKVQLIVAVPRPQIIKRVLLSAVQLGVKKIHFVAAQNSEKTYLQSNKLKDEGLNDEIIKALEQAVDTVPPEVHKWYSYKKCFEENQLASDKLIKIVADSKGKNFNIDKKSSEIFISIGPESGFSNDEYNQHLAIGFKGLNLGERVLNVDVAVTVILGRLG